MVSFAVDVFRRYARRPAHTHLLVWGIGLAMFAVGSVAEAISAFVWSPIVFICWYLFGAALNAGWIGQGTMYLLVRRKWVNVLTAIIVLGSLAAAFLMLSTPLDGSRFSTSLPLSDQYRNIMPQGAPVRLTTPFFNIYGLITLVGGALYSAYLFWRKRVLPNRVIGNVLIAAGALSIGAASTLTRLGLGSYLYVGELVAAILMYSGFVLASQPAAVSETAQTQPQPA
jgi:drug/metabolite transporter (DMT)-like permease